MKSKSNKTNTKKSGHKDQKDNTKINDSDKGNTEVETGAKANQKETKVEKETPNMKRKNDLKDKTIGQNKSSDKQKCCYLSEKSKESSKGKIEVPKANMKENQVEMKHKTNC